MSVTFQIDQSVILSLKKASEERFGKHLENYYKWFDDVVIGCIMRCGIKVDFPFSPEQLRKVAKLHNVKVKQFVNLTENEYCGRYIFDAKSYNVFVEVDGVQVASWIESELKSVKYFVWHKNESGCENDEKK